MAKNEVEALPNVKLSVSIVLEDEKNKNVSDALKPGMYMTYEDMSLDSLAAMCRDEDTGCPFGGFGCPFNHNEWQKLHEGERCTANPCQYVQAKDWLDAFEIYDRERKRKENEYWENA